MAGKGLRLRSKLVHTGKDRDPRTGASAMPIYQISTYAQDDPVEFGEYEYGRGGNPSREAVENAVALLEGGDRGFAFSSGMAAISSVFMLFKPGDHIVVTEDVYGGTYRVLTGLLDRWGLQSTFVDMTDLDAVRAAITPATKALYVETPSNPLLTITDLAAVGGLAKEHGLLAIIDNTFMTPYLQRPIEFGFDVIVHSATKFLGGHSDIIAGVAVTKGAELGKRLKYIQNSFGAILGPQDSFLMHRGIKTLGVRMEAQQHTAGLLAPWIGSQAGVVRVHYPLLPCHKGREIHQCQASGGGAVVSFELETAELAKAFLRAARVPLLAVSLGGVESILSYPATMSHAAMPPGERERRGITDGLVRLSVGLEDIDDLKDDINAALDSARRT